MAPFEMTKCNRCGSPMLMGLEVCPSCGQNQVKRGGGRSMQPRTMLAVVLSAAVLFAFNWLKATTHGGATTTTQSVASRPH